MNGRGEGSIYKLGPDSLDYIDRFSRVRLFCRTGIALAGDHVSVSNWRQAVKSCVSVVSNNGWIEAGNHISVQLPHEVYNTWNHVGDAVDQVDRVIDDRLKAAIGSKALPEEAAELIRPDLQWTVGHCIFETEFARHLETTFFRDAMAVLLAGRFPCGYQGDYPDGRTVIY